jgi:hypothetical protein
MLEAVTASDATIAKGNYIAHANVGRHIVTSPVAERNHVVTANVGAHRVIATVAEVNCVVAVVDGLSELVGYCAAVDAYRVTVAVAERDCIVAAQVGGDRVTDTVAEGNFIAAAKDFDRAGRGGERLTVGAYRVMGAVAERAYRVIGALGSLSNTISLGNGDGDRNCIIARVDANSDAEIINPSLLLFFDSSRCRGLLCWNSCQPHSRSRWRRCRG